MNLAGRVKIAAEYNPEEIARLLRMITYRAEKTKEFFDKGEIEKAEKEITYLLEILK